MLKRKDKPRSQRIICGKAETPQVIKHIENWDIIADNTASIKTKDASSGNEDEK